jgi:hypothetical protein
MDQPAIATDHPGPTPDLATTASQPALSPRARWALWWRACHGPIAIAVAVVPAALAFTADRPMVTRGLLLAAAGMTFVAVRGLLRRTSTIARFAERERECRRRWQAALAQWQAEAGPARFDAKAAELDRLEEWWEMADPAQRPTIEAAIRRAVDELRQIAYRIEVARRSLRPAVEAAHAALLQAELDLRTLSGSR